MYNEYSLPHFCTNVNHFQYSDAIYFHNFGCQCKCQNVGWAHYALRTCLQVQILQYTHLQRWAQYACIRSSDAHHEYIYKNGVPPYPHLIGQLPPYRHLHGSVLSCSDLHMALYPTIHTTGRPHLRAAIGVNLCIAHKSTWVGFTMHAYTWMG